MKRILDKIIERIEEREKAREMFIMPIFNDDQLTVTHEDVEPAGSIITGDEWHLSKGVEYLHVEFVSKDKSRTFQEKPDRTYVTIRGKILQDNLLKDIDYSNAWDEKH